MVSPPTSRQAEILSVITADPEQDLYQISAYGTTLCPVRPLRGLVCLSPLTEKTRTSRRPDAFSKMDPAGPDDLSNSWLNITPTACTVPPVDTGRTNAGRALSVSRRFPAPRRTPYSRDRAPEANRSKFSYRDKEQGRAKWAASVPAVGTLPHRPGRRGTQDLCHLPAAEAGRG